MEQRFVGKPAGLAIDHFKVAFDDLERHHEQWQLSAISFEVMKGRHTQRVFLWLDAKGTHWPRVSPDIDTIRKLKVNEITFEQIDMEKKLVGKLAAEALDYYKVGFDDLGMTDEPPCCLDAVSFDVRRGEHTHSIYLWLQGDVTRYRENMDWDIESIRRAKVIRITTESLF